MSSRRYQEDIRRIVGLQDTLRGLDDELPRMRIEGSRGIFLIGAGETKSGAAPGVNEDGETTDPLMPDENEDNLNEDGSGTGGSGTDPAETDGGDLLTDPENYGGFSPDDSTFGGDWGSGGVSTFTDCASGKCIEIVESGGYVPPEGWDDPDTPPPWPEWEQGFRWSRCTNPSASNGCYLAPTPGQHLERLNAESGDQWRYAAGSSGDIRLTEYYNTSLERWMGAGSAQKHPCLSGEGCVSEQPIQGPNWPADNCIQLAKNSDGQWAASSREDPADMTTKYSEAKSILDLCAPNGDGVQILPGADGGSVRWNYTQGRFMATSPEGRRSFGGATELTTAVAGSVKDGGAIKAQGAPVPTT